jgi:hypothetical protein
MVRDTTADNRNKGQTLVIAIMVMFLLAMVAAVFIGIVARNLFRSERFSNVDAVAQIAEAGVRYADKMLTTSEDGADWRPQPENDGVEKNPDGTIIMENGKPKPGTTTPWQTQRDRNPDFQWTRAYWPEELEYCGPTGGYSSFSTGGGRFLLRVSYNPNPNDTYSKYIKIESIGRWGTYVEDDPTTWKPHGNVLMRREITAYKPIGITDYVRFVTNKDERSMDMPLGRTDHGMTFGRSVGGSTVFDSKFGARGGAIRVNGNLLWYGDVTVNLRGTHPLKSDGSVDTDRWIPLDAVEVSGDIKLSESSTVKVRRLDNTGGFLNETTMPPSDQPGFTTLSGFYRDGSDLTDAEKNPRGVKRIEPPAIDQADPTGTTTRYRLLTLNSGQRIRVGRRWFNLGQYGWGRGVYIGNTRDKQDESETLIGGYTLQADWLKPNSPMSTYWKGPYYEPPGAVIILHPGDTDGDDQPDFTIIRTDTQSNGEKWCWYDAWGIAHVSWGSRVTMPYPDAKRGRVIYARNDDGSVNRTVFRRLDGNGVIYAEGNIRIRGMLPKDMQLTVVSNENIYIEGNLLKYRDPSVDIDAKDAYRGTADTSTCGLALLARQNICVNTTQFMRPLMGIGAEDLGSDARNGQPPYHLIVSSNAESRIRCGFDFGPWESETLNAAPTEWTLFLRHAGDYGATYINTWLNPSSAVTNWGLLNLQNVLPAAVLQLPSYVWGVGDPRFNASGWGVGSTFACDAFSLITCAPQSGLLKTRPGIENTLMIGLDQTTYTRNNYLMGGIAIQPMDIRIEAVLYAQEGSFFVIPGNWFNPNPEDVAGGTRPAGVAPEFPYYGDPLDVRVIVDGAVSENIPAPISAVNDWMAKWSGIPSHYGSTNTPTAHSGEGLTILYDDHAGWPYTNLGSATLNPIRTDKFGRPLPIAPRLPVCGSLIYFGDVM